MKESVKSFLSMALRRKVYLAGLIIVSLFVLVGILAPYLLTRPEDAWGLSYNAHKIRLPPSLEHPFGTDEFGRDVFNRVVLGARYSLVIGLSVVVLSLAIGVPLGLVAGYLGGWVGSAIMRVADVFLAFPPLLLAVAFAATLGRGLFNVIMALALSWWPWYARLMYIQVTAVKSMPFIEAAKVVGLSPLAIMFRHVLPNTLTAVVTQATLDVGSAILESAALSFLGVGVPPPIPEWGALISQGWTVIEQAWWVSLFPGLCLLTVVVGFNLLGDALKEYLDPRLRHLVAVRL